MKNAIATVVTLLEGDEVIGQYLFAGGLTEAEARKATVVQLNQELDEMVKEVPDSQDAPWTLQSLLDAYGVIVVQHSALIEVAR